MISCRDRSASLIPGAEKIRTIWFLFALIPLGMAVAAIGILSLIICLPLIIYSSVVSTHLKNPLRKRR